MNTVNSSPRICHSIYTSLVPVMQVHFYSLVCCNWCTIVKPSSLCAQSLLLFSADVAVSLSPQSQTVGESQEFVFPCTNPSVSSPPTWIINGVHYFPSELPPNYCINATGLIGVATADLNQSTYQCVFITATFAGGFLATDTIISSPAAVLTVIGASE